MVKITKSEREALERVGLLRHKKVGYNACDPSFYVANKEHTGRNKHTYIVESPEVMKFLGRYEDQNLQRINEKQYESLCEAGLVNEKNTQYWGQYNPKAICYQSQFGEFRIAKITPLMMHLGLWKDNKRKKMAKMQSRMMAENGSDFVGNELGVNDLGDNSMGDTMDTMENMESVMPDINEQAKQLGNPLIIFRDVDTGEVVKSGDLSLLTGIGLSLDNMVKADGTKPEIVMNNN